MAEQKTDLKSMTIPELEAYLAGKVWLEHLLSGVQIIIALALFHFHEFYPGRVNLVS